VDVTGENESLFATHYHWADSSQSVPASRYCAPQWSPDGELIGAIRGDRVGVDTYSGAFATFGVSGQDERTVFTDPNLPTYCGFGRRDFTWKPLR
jgi:hypothetical protein